MHSLTGESVSDLNVGDSVCVSSIQPVCRQDLIKLRLLRISYHGAESLSRLFAAQQEAATSLQEQGQTIHIDA